MAVEYSRWLWAVRITALKDWVTVGVTIMSVRGASVFASLKDVALTSTKLVGSDDDDQKGKTEEKKEPGPAASPSPSPTPRPRDRRQVTEADMDQAAEPKTDRESGIAPSLPPIASPSANANKVP